MFFIKILVSIMDQISIYKWHIIYAENANYLLCFQDKTSIKLFLMVLNTVLNNEITFLQNIILILKTILGENILMLVAKRI